MLEHLIGNQAVKDVIKRLVIARRIPNALLFAGPEGVGKKQFALELAKTIICRGPRDHEACDECPACRRAMSFKFPASDDKDEHKKVILSEHADVGMVIAYNRNILVDAIRDLESEANFRPFEAASRIFIIDDAHKMNDAASNALLKTLEEPPSTSHIFLISSRPDSLLATIRSRSQLLRFAPVDTAEIEHLLLRTHQYSQEDARLIAICSMGSVARAISVNVDEFQHQRAVALDVLRSAVVNKDLVTVLKKAEEVSDAKNKAGFEGFLDVLSALIRDVWVRCLDRKADRERAEELDGLAESAEPARLAAWLREIEMIRDDLAVNINKRVATDALFVGMASH